MAISLWGSLDDVKEEIREPKDILQEQIDILEAVLDELVRGAIIRCTDLDHPLLSSCSSNNIDADFNYSFVLFSNYVEKYNYEVCKMTYGIKIYPVGFTVSDYVCEELSDSFEIADANFLIANDEKSFVEILEAVLNSTEVRQVLRGLVNIAKKEKKDLPF